MTIFGILGIYLCAVSITGMYRQLVYIFLGKCAKGIIIGYGNLFFYSRGIKAYPYKVMYKYDNKEYIAYSLEGVIPFCGKFPNENLQREITIYFKKDKPEEVIIKEFNNKKLILGIIILILGILLIIL